MDVRGYIYIYIWTCTLYIFPIIYFPFLEFNALVVLLFLLELHDDMIKNLYVMSSAPSLYIYIYLQNTNLDRIISVRSVEPDQKIGFFYFLKLVVFKLVV